MADPFARDTQEMRQAASFVETSIKNVENIQKTLYDEINVMLTHQWKGQAAYAFLTSFKQYDEKFAKVQSELETFHSNLVTSELQYNRNEAEQSDAAAAMQNVINAGPTA